MIFEEINTGKFEGTKISWVIQNDLRGVVPRAIINSRAVKNPKTMIE